MQITLAICVHLVGFQARHGASVVFLRYGPGLGRHCCLGAAITGRASQGVSDSLDALETAITLNDLDLSWKLFFKLAEAPGENFGTWAI